jgi:hypothetical protein
MIQSKSEKPGAPKPGAAMSQLQKRERIHTFSSFLFHSCIQQIDVCPCWGMITQSSNSNANLFQKHPQNF